MECLIQSGALATVRQVERLFQGSYSRLRIGQTSQYPLTIPRILCGVGAPHRRGRERTRKGKITMQLKPYCPQCGTVKPDDTIAYTCLPCAKKGHIYRLVTSDGDRLSRIQLFAEFYKTHKYTTKEIEAIPTYQRLLNPPTGAIIHVPTPAISDSQTC